jgi:hypothetical protein
MRYETEHSVTPGDGKRRQHSGLWEADSPALAEFEAADAAAEIGDDGVATCALRTTKPGP